VAHQAESRSFAGAAAAYRRTDRLRIVRHRINRGSNTPRGRIGSGRQFSPEQIMVAMQSLPSHQKLNIETRAVHAAAFWNTRAASLPCARTLAAITPRQASGALARASVVAGEGINSSHQPNIS